MNIQLIDGEFSANDALDLITKMVHIKIKYHEDKINNSNNEEDSKVREQKIKTLQKELYEVRQNISSRSGMISVKSVISL